MRVLPARRVGREEAAESLRPEKFNSRSSIQSFQDPT
jgi:hypothetical protein